jgi:hypothetical protein
MRRISAKFRKGLFSIVCRQENLLNHSPEGLYYIWMFIMLKG